jgi:hypothetical protein
LELLISGKDRGKIKERENEKKKRTIIELSQKGFLFSINGKGMEKRGSYEIKMKKIYHQMFVAARMEVQWRL